MPPEIDNLQNLPPEICENWYHIFEEGKCVQIPDIEEMRLSDPLQYENLKRQKIHSIVAMPIYDAEKVIAFYGVDNPPAFSLEYTSDMLQIMGSFLKSLSLSQFQKTENMSDVAVNTTVRKKSI